MNSILKALSGGSKVTDSSSSPEAPGQTLPATGTPPTGGEGGAEDSYANIASITPQIAVINLDIRGYFTPYNVPVLEKIIHAVQIVFKDDPGLRLQQLRGAGTGIYRILLSKPVQDISNKFVCFKDGDSEVKVPLQ